MVSTQARAKPSEVKRSGSEAKSEASRSEPIVQAREIRLGGHRLVPGVLGVPPDPFAPRQGPLGSSPDRDSAIGNARTLEPAPLARLRDLQLRTGLSPQVTALAWSGFTLYMVAIIEMYRVTPDPLHAQHMAV